MERLCQIVGQEPGLIGEWLPKLDSPCDFLGMYETGNDDGGEYEWIGTGRKFEKSSKGIVEPPGQKAYQEGARQDCQDEQLGGVEMAPDVKPVKNAVVSINAAFQLRDRKFKKLADGLRQNGANHCADSPIGIREGRKQ